ncbi:MAG: aminotransferase class V-fold PLP-dependent enzyme [Lachnospiraceae bacterium]|nr:aminotransferase class V-fold PLP-dependent enzyme [Lachnospiraceae bacterium]
MKTDEKLNFACDYMEGAHPAILEKMQETNWLKTAGYGLDEFSESAREKIRKACNCPDAEVYFMTGGTQTNAVVIDAFLQSYQGVIASDTGHISVHEAGAIEFGGHKVLPIPHHFGKISAAQIQTYMEDFIKDANHDHMVMPGLVYLSQPTEYGTLYSLEEMTQISTVCSKYHIPLYVDGARLAYALASSRNDVTLEDMARLCDAFYIGGTKCGALFGEAVVIPKPNRLPHFFTIMKQHGALFAKGRMLGIQFDVLFTDNLYQRIGIPAVELAAKIQTVFQEASIKPMIETETNQVFLIIENSKMEELSKKVEFGFWEKYDQNHTIIRLAASWATKEEEVALLRKYVSE